MNPFLIELLTMIFRQAIIYLAGVIGVSALASEHMSQVEQYSASAAVFALTVGYAAYRRYKAKQVLVTALASPMPMSEHECKELVKDPSVITPSVTSSKDAIPA